MNEKLLAFGSHYNSIQNLGVSKEGVSPLVLKSVTRLANPPFDNAQAKGVLRRFAQNPIRNDRTIGGATTNSEKPINYVLLTHLMLDQRMSGDRIADSITVVVYV